MECKQKNFISAVIYIHNEENRIEEFLGMLINCLDENFEHAEIICVNDYSEDKSIEKIKCVSTKVKNVNISLLNMSSFHGIEIAMNAGRDCAIGDFVFEFDSVCVDYDVNEIMRVYEKALTGFDIVSAVPKKREKISSKLFYYVFDSFTNLSYQMHTESFRILSRRAINRISSMNKTVPYRKAIYAHCGLKSTYQMYQVMNQQRNEKQEKLEKRYRKKLAFDTLILFTEMGYRFSMGMTILMIMTTVFMAGYSIVTYIFNTPVEGWTTTILFLSVVFLGQFGIMTVIIKYLQILLDLVFKNQRYSYESIEKL